MKKILLSIAFLFTINSSFAQLTVNGSLTPQQLVQTILIGNGVSASNVTYTGAPAAIGSFNGTNTNVGFLSGILLTTGGINNALPPNVNSNMGTDNSTQGDTQLTQISGQVTNDAAVLEFDFVPASDTLRFNYVFASEEYPNFVGTDYNDVFGFFITGPGIVGSQNIALIPGTTTPVSISGVNNGSNDCDLGGPNGPCQNCSYYVNNCNGSTIDYNGFTTPLIAQAIVQCGETYHIKLAIADAVDNSYDSGVFLEAGSFGTSGVQITATASASGDSTIVEGCGSAVFTFSRPDTSSAFTINFNIQGTAIPGLDYNQILDSIVIPQGQFSEQLFVDAFVDGIPDSIETITITIDFISGCGGDTLYATIFIQSVDSIKVIKGEDYNICTPDETATLKATATGGSGPLTFTWSNDAGVGDSVVVVPLETTKYFVTVTDTCGNFAYSDSIEVVVQCDVIVPNYLTPGSSDTLNNTFFIENLDQYPGSGLLIYNRWGRKVYENNDYKNDWDGEDFAEGTYMYILSVSDPEQGTKKGFLTLFRN